MGFFSSAVDVLQKLVIGLGAGLGVWGGINLMEGYGNDNPGAKSQGMKQLVAGGGVALIRVQQALESKLNSLTFESDDEKSGYKILMEVLGKGR